MILNLIYVHDMDYCRIHVLGNTAAIRTSDKLNTAIVNNL
jgi:hypothetical protein